mgnify:CR=1 FL=1
MTNEAYDNTTTLDPRIAQRLKHDDKGLVAAVIQQFDTKEVLMVGYMNDEAIRRTLTTGRVTFWSRSRQEYWRKGDTSGHAQYVKSFALDCDGDAILVEVDQVGAIPANVPALKKADSCLWSWAIEPKNRRVSGERMQRTDPQVGCYMAKP